MKAASILGAFLLNLKSIFRLVADDQLRNWIFNFAIWVHFEIGLADDSVGQSQVDARCWVRGRNVILAVKFRQLNLHFVVVQLRVNCAWKAWQLEARPAWLDGWVRVEILQNCLSRWCELIVGAVAAVDINWGSFDFQIIALRLLDRDFLERKFSESFKWHFEDFLTPLLDFSLISFASSKLFVEIFPSVVFALIASLLMFFSQTLPFSVSILMFFVCRFSTWMFVPLVLTRISTSGEDSSGSSRIMDSLLGSEVSTLNTFAVLWTLKDFTSFTSTSSCCPFSRITFTLSSDVSKKSFDLILIEFIDFTFTSTVDTKLRQMFLAMLAVRRSCLSCIIANFLIAPKFTRKINKNPLWRLWRSMIKSSLLGIS